MSEYYDVEYYDDDVLDGNSSRWSDGYSEGYSLGKRDAMYAIARYLADDWEIVSRETLPKIFDLRNDQNELWDCLVLARKRKLKDLQSEVKKLEKKLDKMKEKNKEKKHQSGHMSDLKS